MINKKIVGSSRIISLFYLSSFLFFLLLFIFTNQSYKSFLALFIGYWLLPIPIIIIMLSMDNRRRQETIIGFIAAILLIPIIGNFLFILNGIISYTKEDQIVFTNQISSIIKNNSIIDKNTFLKGAVTATYEKSYCFLDSSSWMNSIHDAILNAKNEICISFFYILQGRNKSALLKALKIKLKQGVKVYVAIDGSSKMFGAKNNDLISLEKEGAIIEIIKQFKGRFPTSFSANLRAHYKVVIIDAHKCFVGGANIGDLYIHQKKRMGYWNDNYFYIQGSNIAQILKRIISINANKFHGFEYVWEEKSDSVLNNMEVIENQPEYTYIKHEAAVKKLMEKCKKKFYIYIPYLSSPEWLIKGLINLAKKGIDVKVMIPHYADKKSVYIITKYNASRLNKKNIKVLMLKHSYVHSKTILCDDVVFSGTNNFDNRSFYMNYELMFLINEPNSTRTFFQKWYYDELSCIKWNNKKHKLSHFGKVLLPFLFLFRTTF